MTQLEFASRGEITCEMRQVAESEGLKPDELCELVKKGRAVILKNVNNKNRKVVGIGEGLRIKVNTNIGSSYNYEGVERELRKLEAAIKAGADTVMDLSTGRDLLEIRRKVLERSPVPVGTVPIYEVACTVAEREGSIVKMKVDDILRVIERQGQEGVDFMTIHCGLTMELLEKLRKSDRIMKIVSRGGSFLACWMVYNEKENPLYEHFDKILEIARKYDIVLSLGDSLRPGCVVDGLDSLEVEELAVLGRLARRAREAGVQVIIEGPGHMPLNQIETIVKLEKEICNGAPFYVLGPAVTDIAPGFDHITTAIGGALGALYGIDFLCTVTPSEHLGLPTEDDIYIGTLVTKIAAHAGNIVRGFDLDKELEMAKARRDFNWEEQKRIALTPQAFEKYDILKEGCSMCTKFCALKLVRTYLEGGK